MKWRGVRVWFWGQTMVLENDADLCALRTGQADTGVADGAIARVWMIAKYLGFKLLFPFYYICIHIM